MGLANPVRAAGTILDSAGFESPLYSTSTGGGALQNQQGWKKVSIGSGLGTATVQNTVVQSGSQAIRVNRAANSDDRWAVPNLWNLVGQPSVPTVRFALVEWDMRVTQSSTVSPPYGPFFGVDMYDDKGAFGVLAGFGVDASTGDVLYQVQDTGALAETGVTATFDQWHHFQVLLDFGMRNYRTYFDNNLLAWTGFVDRGSSGTALNELTDADIAAIGAAGDAPSQAATGTAYFDNFAVFNGLPGDFDVDGDVDKFDLNIWKQSVGVNAGADADGDGDSDGADLLVWQRYLQKVVPGDFDKDGDVDSTDLGIWKTANGATANGDADFDGDTDGADLLVWQRNLGHDLTPAAAVVGAVPEPTGATAALLAAAAWSWFRRRRR
jgi:hypothetical protein